MSEVKAVREGSEPNLLSYIISYGPSLPCLARTSQALDGKGARERCAKERKMRDCKRLEGKGQDSLSIIILLPK